MLPSPLPDVAWPAAVTTPSRHTMLTLDEVIPPRGREQPCTLREVTLLNVDSLVCSIAERNAGD
jgi:hypothetical protein